MTATRAGRAAQGGSQPSTADPELSESEPDPISPISPPAPELVQELDNFRREWIQESKRKQQLQHDHQNNASSTLASASAASSSSHALAFERDSQLGDPSSSSTGGGPPSQSSPAAQYTSRSPPPAIHRALSSQSPTSPRRVSHLDRQIADLRLREQHSQLSTATAMATTTTATTTTSAAGKPKPSTAVELYDAAVISEREGRLNDALSHYRAAFKLDSDVDRTYHRLSQRVAAKGQTSFELLPSTSTTASTEFAFERTIQLTPDYSAEREHRSAQAVEESTGSAPESDHDLHPSSTAFLFDSLARSIATNVWDPTKREHVLSSEPNLDVALDRLTFLPADPERPLPLASLPREVLLLVLRHLVLSSVIPPPRPPPTPHHADDASKPQARKKGPRKLTLAEHTQLLELSFDLPADEVRRPWRTDVEALERFARSCRFARFLTLDSSLWRKLCQRVYVQPHQTREDLVSILVQHGEDWRRCFIEHPRIRFDGAYISVVTYLRRGDNSSWYSPTHLITFYRYLRFYSTGIVESLLTVDPPSSVVRTLNPALRVKGLTFGRWRLRGERIDLWDLVDPNVDEDNRKYSFKMECRLKSTNRGRMNKLDMISLATEHRQTLEVEPVPIKPTKPFYFSKVSGYAGDDRE